MYAKRHPYGAPHKEKKGGNVGGGGAMSKDELHLRAIVLRNRTVQQHVEKQSRGGKSS